MSPALPLDGITVIALEHAVAAPFATRQLADLGARVIKIERPGVGDFARHYDHAVAGESSYFVWLNRGKQSVELDLSEAADAALLTTMLSQADVFVQNLAPGAVERLGFGNERLRALNPRLITCSISGYGDGGPLAGKKAYDLLIQCETGLVSVTGTPQEMAKVGISIADIATGMYAYTGVLTALYERERTGVGSHLDVAMIDAMGEWMSQPAYYFGPQTPVRRTGARHGTIAPYGPYTTAEGATVFLAVQSDREWRVLCDRVLDDAELAADDRFTTNPLRVANIDELNEIIGRKLVKVVAEVALERLDKAGIASAQIRTPQEFVAHPQLAARDRWREVATPHGDIRAMLPPVTIAGRTAAMGPVPALGEHTTMIRDEFGGRT